MPYRSRPSGKACKNKLLRQNCPIMTLESNMSQKSLQLCRGSDNAPLRGARQGFLIFLLEQSALRADFSTAASLSGTSALGSYGIRAAFDYFPLVIDHPVGRVPDTPYSHLMPTVRTDQGVPPRALLIPLPIG